MLSKLTIVGLTRFSDGHLWDNLDLPEGIDKDVFINQVILRGGEFPLLYPDLEFMKFQIGEFSKKWKRTFERWAKADEFEYEALFNLDVTTVRTETGNNEENESISSNSSHNELGSGNSTGNGSSTHSKAAYDSGTFQPTEMDVNSNSVTSNSSSNGSKTESEISSGKSKHNISIEEVRRGNQGVTMSQELLDAERNVWMWNIYTHAADLFINEYCVCLYC